MKAWEIVFGWNDGENEPLQDGTYYVATYYAGTKLIDIRTLDFTVEYGWNTTKNAHESAFEIEEPYWWTPAIRMGQDELVILPPSEEVVG